MWIIYALLYAVITSVHIPIIKKVSSHRNAVAFIFAANLFIIPMMLLGVFIFGGVPLLRPQFYSAMVLASALDTAAFILAVQAFARSELSLVVPLASFLPVFSTIIDFLIFGGKFSFAKGMAIVLIVCGTYILYLPSSKGKLFAPFKAFSTTPGAVGFMTANLIWSVVPIFQKQATFSTVPNSPQFIATLGTILMSLYILPIAIIKRKQMITMAGKYAGLLLFAGVLVTAQQFFLQTAYSLENVGYVLAIGKMSSLLVVVWGMLFFREKYTPYKLIGAIIMIIGTTLLV